MNKGAKQVAKWLIIFVMGQLLTMFVSFLFIPFDMMQNALNVGSVPDWFIEYASNTQILGGIVAVILLESFDLKKRIKDTNEPIVTAISNDLGFKPLKKARDYLWYFGFGVSLNVILTIIIAIVLATLFVILELLGVLDNIDQNMFNTVAATPSVNMFMITVVAILVPICEEIMFRKKIYDGCYECNPKIAIYLQALFFALLHGAVIQSLYTFVFALLFMYEDKKQNSIIPSIMMHCGINFVYGLSNLNSSLLYFIAIPISLCGIPIYIRLIKRFINYTKRKVYPTQEEMVKFQNRNTNF